MKAADVPELPVLELLAKNKAKWHNWFPDDEDSVRKAMPPETPSKVALAKMRNLIKRGLVDGCPCGCRGDFHITPKGLEYLQARQNKDVSK